MSSYFEAISYQAAVFAILIVLGFIAAKVNFLKQKYLDVLSKLLINIAMPFLILTSILGGGVDRSDIPKALPFLILSFLLLISLSGLGKITTKISGIKGKTANIHIAETTFGNAGFMGIPLLLALFPGGEGMFYLSVYFIADHTLLWTWGDHLASRHTKERKKFNFMKLINPNTIALVIALILLALGITLPDLVKDSLGAIGDTSKSWSMVYIGGTLAYINFKDAFKKPSIYLLVLGKLIIWPIVVVGFVKLIHLVFPFTTLWINDIAIFVLAILAALPSMVSISMLATQYGSDDQYAASCVFVTTVASLFTLPFITWLLGIIGIA